MVLSIFVKAVLFLCITCRTPPRGHGLAAYPSPLRLGVLFFFLSLVLSFYAYFDTVDSLYNITMRQVLSLLCRSFVTTELVSLLLRRRIIADTASGRRRRVDRTA